MTAKQVAKRCGCKLWKVYYVGDKMNLNRLPTVDEVLNYKDGRGRPRKVRSYADNE